MSECPIYPKCSTQKSIDQIISMVNNLSSEYRCVISITEQQSDKLDKVVKDQQSMIELWEKFYARMEHISSLTANIINLNRALDEFKEDTKRVHDFFGAEMRAIQEKKMSKEDAARYARWTGGIIVGMVGLIELVSVIMPIIKK